MSDLNDPNENPNPVVNRHLVPERQRVAVTASLFGPHFPLQIEPVVYSTADQMAEDYCGGYWQFYTLSNAGFYLSPDEDRSFDIKCQNYFSGSLSADALGIVCCLYAY